MMDGIVDLRSGSAELDFLNSTSNPVEMLPDSKPDDDKSIPLAESVFSCVERKYEDAVMDAEEKEFDLDMDIIEPPLARPQEILSDKGTMLKCVHDPHVRAGKNLSPQERAKVTELLVGHNETTFHDPDKSLTRTNTIEHKIPMTGRPVRIPPCRVALGQRKIVEDEILKMEKEGTITKRTGTWCFPIVLVRKKDGIIRFCVDYRKLNDVTHKDAYPLPRINDILEVLRGAKYFCSINLTSGYWQIKVVEKDRERRAFGSHLGLYEFLCMPFGLTGAPAMFSRLLDKVLDGLIGKGCLVYLDNVIIYGKTFKETLANLKLVMACLREHNLLAKAQKCELFEMSIAFLGHIVSEEGIATDPTKVEKIYNLSAPKDKGGIRSILGLGNYYKWFIMSYCVITAPLQELLKKLVHLMWTMNRKMLSLS